MASREMSDTDWTHCPIARNPSVVSHEHNIRTNLQLLWRTTRDGPDLLSHPLSEREQAKYKVERAELDMLLCEVCGERAFRHLRRMLPDRHLGYTRRSES